MRVFQFPGRPTPPTNNQFRTFAVAMPAQLLPLLQSRLTGILIFRLYGLKQPHGLSYNELMDLDNWLAHYEGADAVHVVLDGRLLSLFKRFLEAERVIVGRHAPQLMPTISNADMWVLLGELLERVIWPTQVVKLSFYGRA